MGSFKCQCGMWCVKVGAQVSFFAERGLDGSDFVGGLDR